MVRGWYIVRDEGREGSGDGIWEEMRGERGQGMVYGGDGGSGDGIWEEMRGGRGQGMVYGEI